MRATLITLAHSTYEKGNEFEEVLKIAKKIEKHISDKEDMELLIKMNHSNQGRVHHHVLVNRSLEGIDLKWSNGPVSVENIADKDHYQKAKEYVIT